MGKNHGHIVTVDDEVHSIVTRYANINGISTSEALRRLVLNAQAEEAEVYDGMPGLISPEEAKAIAHHQMAGSSYMADNARPF